MMLYVGEGPRGSQGACSTLHRIAVTPSTTHNQIGPLCCWFPSGWAYACSRPLWVFPTTSPVRLGVSPAAYSTPVGVFTQRSEALFPPRWSPGLHSLLRSRRVVLVYLCANVGRGVCYLLLYLPVLCHSEFSSLGLSVHKCRAAGSASGQTACPVHPTLHQSWSHHSHMSPLSPGACLRPSYWSGCYVSFLSTWCHTSLPFDFLSVVVVRGGTVCLPTPPSWFFFADPLLIF